MYALFKDGKQISGEFNQILAVWAYLLMMQIPVNGNSTCSNLNIILPEGYDIRGTIEEVKE